MKRCSFPGHLQCFLELPGAPRLCLALSGRGESHRGLRCEYHGPVFSPSEILPRRCNTMIVFSSCCTWTPAILSSCRVTMEAHRARRCFYVLPSPSLSSNYVLQRVTTVCCPLPVWVVTNNYVLQCVTTVCCTLPVWAVLPYVALSQFKQ